MAKQNNLTALPNIGQTLANRLAAIGIYDKETLAETGPALAYQRICDAAGRTLPVCYNLYSLEAALRGHDWRLLSDADKKTLQQAAKLEKKNKSPAVRRAQ